MCIGAWVTGDYFLILIILLKIITLKTYLKGVIIHAIREFPTFYAEGVLAGVNLNTNI